MAKINVLSVEGLTKRYGEKLLFEGLTFGLSAGQRVAIVAKNGSGKTTLMNAICGIEPSEAGKIVFSSNVRWSYLKQEAELDAESTLLDSLYIGDSPAIVALKNYERVISESLEGDHLQKATDEMDRCNAWNYEARAKEILGKLNLHDLNRTIKTLSGGEKRRAALAQVLLEDPELLFLDEPTNHLDLEMIAWLEKKLASSNKTLLMITHDRYFLENVCSDIFELDDQSLFHYKGNFSYYLDKRDERRENALAVRDRARQGFKRELAWMRSTPSARTGKSKSRINRFYDIKKEAKKRLEEDPMHISVIPQRLGGKIVELHNISKKYNERTLFKGLTHHFKQGERLGIVGNNGSGKTSLLKLITGEENTDSGKVVIGDTVVFGHYHQQGGVFSEEWKVIDAVREIADFIPLKGGAKLTASQLLERFMFPRSIHHKYIKVLSGGERKRLNLLRILIANPNFLILDEPTNDLDIFTLTVLEEFLMDFQGCIIVVSHDRYFMDKIVEHIWVLGEYEGVTDYPGNFTQYRLASEEKLKKVVSSPKPQIQNPEVKGDYTTRLSYKEKFEFEKLGPKIEELENKRDELSKRLESNPPHDEFITIGEELGKVAEEIEKAEMRWLELVERAE
ncbi:MAG: ABC transporter [Crocinitomicaceae bacterium]|nr:ABC transporter [Crocinitomicaceae bacterium]|tara:strand:+ start:9325 stop:11193 length:1869 start_codon:yes stop_codon:yes gene_type:complete